MIKGFPASAFNDGDILISPHDTSEQWLLSNGKLTKIANSNANGVYNFEERVPGPNETFYRMATSMGDALLMKLDLADLEGKIEIEEYKKLRKMVESGDDEARHLVNLHLDNLGK